MKTIGKLGVLIAALLAICTNSSAQPTTGEWELTLGGSGSADNELKDGGFNLGASLGYFFTESLEAGLRQSVGYTDNAGADWSGSTRVFGDYHFNLGQLRPFIGANFGLAYGSEADDVWAMAPELGAKFYVKDQTFILAMVEYQFFFDRVQQADDSFDEGQFLFTLGIGFNF